MTKKNRKATKEDATRVALKIEILGTNGKKSAVNAFVDDHLIHTDSFSIVSHSARAKFAKSVAQKVKVRFKIDFAETEIEQALMFQAALLDVPTDGSGEGDRVPGAAYEMVVDESDAGSCGIYRITASGKVPLTNFTMLIEREVTIEDDVEATKRFEGTIELERRETPFEISAHEFSDPRLLKASVYKSAGSRARFLAAPQAVCDAVSSLSNPQRVVRTTNFGWSGDGGAVYMARSGRIDGRGFRRYESDQARVDLDAEQCARWLDLRRLKPNRLLNTRRHLVNDFLRLHDRTVTFSVLAAVALAVLFDSVEAMNRFALWLCGITGGGKSFLARLAQNFFGDFPIELGARVGSWTSTVNALQRQGFYFKDCIYLIDDYKQENTRHYEVVRLLQNYADGSARARLNADSSSKQSREIRGLLLATGEDVPEHSSSALARSIIIDVPQRPQELERGSRCLVRRPYYRGVMADFIRWLIAEDRRAAFAARVRELVPFFLAGIETAQNGLRIAGNLALLGAAFEEFARYLSDVWDDSAEEAAGFVNEDLLAIRDRMIGAVRDQQASEIFLGEVVTLIAFDKIRLSHGLEDDEYGFRRNLPLVGCMAGTRMTDPLSGTGPVVELSLTRALAEVQKSLADQRKPPLQITASALIGQFVDRGLLLDADGEVIGQQHSGDRTFNRRLRMSQIRIARLPASILHEEVGGEEEDEIVEDP